jgi:hypothetical protein
MAKIVPIKKEQHQSLKVSAKRDLSHVAGQHIVPVNAREFAQAATSYPVVFVKDPDADRYRSVVMLGFDAGENLYYHEDRWNALYVPQSIGMIPFALGLDPEKEKTLTTCIDLESPFVGEDKEQALFDEAGKETEFFNRIQDNLGRLYENEVASEKFTEEMVTNELMQELELTISYANGEKKKLVGIYTINEQKMQNLADDKALDFYKRGMFVPMHAMLGSIGQINRLIQMRNDSSNEQKINGVQIRAINEEAKAEA